MNHARDDYSRLMGQSAAGGSLREEEIEALARNAEALGRRFEARGWWSIRARQSPDDHTARAALCGPACRTRSCAEVVPFAQRAACGGARGEVMGGVKKRCAKSNEVM